MASAGVGPHQLPEPGPALLIQGTYPTGTYLVPRRLVLELSGIRDDASPAVDQAIDAVETAVLALGYRGEWEMSRDEEHPSVTWTFRATETVPLAAVEEAARRALRHHNPGSWSLTSR